MSVTNMEPGARNPTLMVVRCYSMRDGDVGYADHIVHPHHALSDICGPSNSIYGYVDKATDEFVRLHNDDDLKVAWEKTKYILTFSNRQNGTYKQLPLFDTQLTAEWYQTYWDKMHA